MTATNITLPQAPSVDDLWAIIQEQQALLARYHSVTQETRFWAAGQKIELPKFARFDPAVSDRHDRLLSLVDKADSGMVFAKTSGVRICEFHRPADGRVSNRPEHDLGSAQQMLQAIALKCDVITHPAASDEVSAFAVAQ